MTLILAVKDPANKRVIVCADSGAWRGDEVSVLGESKLWRSNGWVCGLAGMSSQREIASRMVMPQLSTSATFDHAHTALHIEVLPELEERLAKRNELVKRSAGDEYKADGHSMIVAFGAWCWYVCAGVGVATTRQFEACGAGGDYALGAAQALLESRRSPDEIAEWACRSTGAITRNVLPPWTWMATDGTEWRWE